MQDFTKETTCCFTGHRPDKLIFGEAESKRLLSDAVNDAVAAGYTSFITGMAAGIDVWAAEIVLELKKTAPGLCLICALPKPNFERGRSAEERERYQRIIRNADSVVTVSQSYSRDCYQKRNIYMVDRSSRVIAAYCGIKGGTKNTLDYAAKHGVDTVNIFG